MVRKFGFVRWARAMALVLASLVLVSPIVSQERTDASLASELDAYVRGMVSSGTFTGTVLAARGGRILLCKGYGMADRERGIRNDIRTRYRLGSVSKNFTAAAVLLLQERGALSIDDPISRYLPGLFEGKGITIRHLLTHTSGLPDYILFPGAFEAFAEATDPDALLASIAAPDLEFEPGTKFRYSNSGYVVLGRIVEVVSGMEYEDFLGTELFRPAGMSDAGCDYEEGLAAGDVAVGYHYTGEDYVPVPRWDSSWAAGAGAVCASAVDLYSWSRALARGRILSDRSRDLLFGPTPQSRNAYGMGWYLRPNDCRARTYHGGYVFGFRSDFTRYPGEEADIIVLSNVDQAPTRRMAEDLAAILFGIPYDPPEFRVPASLPSSGLKNFEGVYDTSEIFGDGASMQVWTEGPRIWYRGNTVYDSLGLPMHIYPLEGGGFFDKTGDVKYEFIPGPDGAAEAVVVSDAYESYRFPRIPSR
ncbi:MAG TPA: serine hydrolase domain-containing protein [Spirochaetia bacterium]|nr:serine hydrolase domain-containing protein [Spirochaetales bacterium]HRY81041.1 serine hydrolase domain-containing protein [Spirochaetia bacterium]